MSTRVNITRRIRLGMIVVNRHVPVLMHPVASQLVDLCMYSLSIQFAEVKIHHFVIVVGIVYSGNCRLTIMSLCFLKIYCIVVV